MPKFVKGHPGGPGRPRGSRNKTTALIDSLAPLGEETMLRALAEATIDGDLGAARALLARVWPKDRSRSRKRRSNLLETQLETLGGQLRRPVSGSREHG